MIAIKIENYLAASQANINEFLKSFFDGASHTVKNDSIVFPACTIKFGRQQLPKPLSGPWIVVEPIDGGGKDQLRAGGAGVRRESQWRIIVITQTINNDSAPCWLLNDSVSDLLSKILNGARTNLAVGGQRIIRADKSVRRPDPDFQFSTTNMITLVDMSS